VSILEGAVEVFPLFKKDLIQLEAKILNNIAACHRKESNNELVIKFTTKVIARTKYISDSRVLLKAFLRRGLAYEKQAKFLQAKEDMLSVKQIEFDNKVASECLVDCCEAIKNVYDK
jgi:predicted DsbA family dithiol-disulfide isomerase